MQIDQEHILWRIGEKNSKYSYLECNDIITKSRYMNRTCYARNVCLIDGSFTFYTKESGPTLPNPLASMNVNFWWEYRNSIYYTNPFYFNQEFTPVPTNLRRINNSEYYFVTETGNVRFSFYESPNSSNAKKILTFILATPFLTVCLLLIGPMSCLVLMKFLVHS